MYPNELFFARIALDRQRDLIAHAERQRDLRATRADRAPYAPRARHRMAVWLIRWAHRIDPEVARPSRSPRYTA